MKTLTDKQKDVLTFITNKVHGDGFPPTLQEIADQLRVKSNNAVLNHLTALEKKGYIEKRKDGTSRGIRVLKPIATGETMTERRLPLLGSVSAGSPLLAEQNVQNYVAIPKFLMPERAEYFVLQVQGDSMIEAGIHENDLVVVQMTNDVRSGDIVVALIGNETTVKRLMVKNGLQYLKPENSKYADIHPNQEWSVQGKVVALIRQSVN
jgi:repressor LexA